jgi:multidrug efflux pump
VMEVAPAYNQSPEALAQVYVPASGSAATSTSVSAATVSGDATPGSTADAAAQPTQVANPSLRDPSTGSALSTSVRRMVPLTAIAKFYERATPTAVNHQDGEPRPPSPRRRPISACPTMSVAPSPARRRASRPS